MSAQPADRAWLRGEGQGRCPFGNKSGFPSTGTECPQEPGEEVGLCRRALGGGGGGGRPAYSALPASWELLEPCA